MAKKKEKIEYENIFAKIIEHHNTDIRLFLKNINSGTIKIKNQRCLLLRDRLENRTSEDNPNYYYYGFEEYVAEYLVCNYFVFTLLDKSIQEEIYTLLKEYDDSNVIIGTNMLYSAIENKKKEIKEKLLV